MNNKIDFSEHGILHARASALTWSDWERKSAVVCQYPLLFNSEKMLMGEKLDRVKIPISLAVVRQHGILEQPSWWERFLAWLTWLTN